MSIDPSKRHVSLSMSKYIPISPSHHSPLESRHFHPAENISIKENKIDYRKENEKLSEILKSKEIVIFELAEKLKKSGTFQSLELKINELLSENGRLNQIIMEKDEKENSICNSTKQLINENDKLNLIVASLQVENMKLMQSYQNILNENKAINSNFTSKISEITNEKEIISNQLKISNEELEKMCTLLAEQNSKYSKLLNEKETEIATLKQKHETANNSSRILAEELKKLSDLYEDKMKEDEVYNDLIMKSEALILENDNVNTKNIELDKEIELWKMKFLQIEKLLNLFFQKEKNEANINCDNMKECLNFLLAQNNLDQFTSVSSQRNKDVEILLGENKKLMSMLEEKNARIKNLEENILYR